MTCSVIAALADHVLAALDLTSGGPLVDLPADERRRTLTELLGEANRRLAATGAATEEARSIAGNPVLLAETVLDETAPREAAAVYALEHDEELESRRCIVGHRARLAVLRFKAAWALELGERLTVSARRQLLEFERATARLVEELSEDELANEHRRDLSAKLRERIVGHQAELGLLEEALAGYRKLAACAASPGRRVAYASRAAGVLERLGDPAAAMAELQAVMPLLADVEEADDRELWEMRRGSLHAALGGRTVHGGGPRFPWAADLHGTTNRWQEHDVPPGEPIRARLAAAAAAATAECPPEDPADIALRSRLLAQQALMVLDRRDEARSLLDHAEELADAVGDTAAQIDASLIRARWLLLHDDATSAEELYRRLWPRVLAMAPELRADAAGFRIQALARAHPTVPAPLLAEMVELILAALDEALRAALGGTGPARLHARGALQRPLECALLALIDAARCPGTPATDRRRLFDRAWEVVLAARDPELSDGVTRPAAATPAVDAAEKRFHRLLGREVLFGGRGERWRPALQELLDRELEVAAAPPERAARHEPVRGDALAVFPIRDVVKPPRWLVLWRCEERDGSSLIADPANAITAPLRRWTAAEPPGRRRHLSPVGVPPAVEPPEELARIAEQVLPAEARPGADPACRPWDLFLDGPLTELPIEALPASAAGDAFGARFAFRHRLRARSGQPDRPVDLARGWLGVGVRTTGDLPPLEQAEPEVEGLARWLRCQGVPTRVRIGGEATPDRVAEAIAAARPAVLHLACHGIDHGEHPEACVLALTPPPHRPEGALLPFRRIREMPLTGVELVVLSACRSASGRSIRGAPLRGLAWAFLSAGAAQVLASRTLVSDGQTPRVMEVFYRHLVEHPAAEALRRARAECFREVDRVQLATWAIWA